jgi:hypothetical protein
MCALVTPFAIIAILVILVTRLGWPGLLIPMVAIVLIPLQTYLGKINGNII